MTTAQSALVIREAIRDAAREYGVKPSDVHQPPQANKAAIAARAVAIRHAYDQGVSKHDLAEAFGRSWETINKTLLMTKP